MSRRPTGLIVAPGEPSSDPRPWQPRPVEAATSITTCTISNRLSVPWLASVKQGWAGDGNRIIGTSIASGSVRPHSMTFASLKPLHFRDGVLTLTQADRRSGMQGWQADQRTAPDPFWLGSSVSRARHLKRRSDVTGKQQQNEGLCYKTGAFRAPNPIRTNTLQTARKRPK